MMNWDTGLGGSAIPREGFIAVTCYNCQRVLQVPIGPDFWHPASGGMVCMKVPYGCPCGHKVEALSL